MKKLLVFGFLLLSSGILTGQSRFQTAEGNIRFNASSPLEDIKAENSKTSAIIDGRTGELAVVLLVKDFQFRRKLMQEHFNENFMESHIHPKAVFSGKLQGFSPETLGSMPTSLPLLGEITIHAVRRPLETPVQLKKVGETLYLSATFIIAPEDHNIEVPKILFNKIAEEVTVDVNLVLQPKTGSSQ